jgi:Protein of unknown function (DUF2971)
MDADADADDFDRRSCLYHYTSAVGLESILRERVLRATDTAFLNDWQEITYAAKPLIAQMDDAINDPYQRSRLIMEHALSAIKRFVRLDEDLPTPNTGQFIDGATYVACLSEEHDQLGQWRGYGQGGYSIGFRKDGLENLAGNLRKVRYGENGINEICNEILEHFRTRWLGNPSIRGYSDALNFCMPLLSSVKHHAFQQELEWRIIVTDYSSRSPLVKVRTSPRLIPYVELRFDESCIAEIVIGPGGDFHSVRAVRAALQTNGYDSNQVRITHSEAPFRG